MFRLHITFAFLTAILLLDTAFYCLERAERHRYKKAILMSALPRNSQDVQFLLTLQRKNMIQLWNEALDHEQSVLMEVDRKEIKKLRKLLGDRGIKSSIMTKNLERDVSNRSGEDISKPNASNYDFGKYHTFESIVAFLKDITKKHRDISRLAIIGKSYEKRPLYAVEISSKPIWKKRKKKKTKKRKSEGLSSRNSKSRKMILMDCGMHAREWVSIAFCTYFINKLITNYTRNRTKSIVAKYDFTIIPVINPDGYVYTHEHDRTWRKNRSRNRAFPDCRGVDLNRNFNFNSSSDAGCRGSAGPCSPIYCGPRPFSEAPSASMKNLLRRTSGSVKGYFSIHTFGQYWLIPWAKDERKPRDYDEMKRIGKIGVKAISKEFGTKFKVGSASDLIYVANGTLLDYVYENGYSRYSFTLELRDKGKYGFLLPSNQLLPACQETAAGVLAAVKALK